MMNTDAKHFPPIEVWREKGFTPNEFGLWLALTKIIALPLYEGRMIGQFDFADKGYDHGRGRTATWRTCRFDNKQIEPQYLVFQEHLRFMAESSSLRQACIHGDRIGYEFSFLRRDGAFGPSW